ncbi:TPM domain-containing protein [Emticicia sp. CRIBPO]|uniref:TPM domain-containing protein n=1 Tax=Emticicia sp. CRIBPO TaxID=2683258 RepID=UPI001412C9B5|nr:TPM domain-containing protein [Emticicia sp. CRIBPO]NBA88860.1 TPM domain-containing protein [Emticicia sp. CRIBPO]
MSTKLLLLFSILTFGVFAQDIPPKPNPPRLVNDFVGGLLSTDQVNALEKKLVAYNDSTGTQIVVVIVRTTEPYETSEYAFKLGREWGVGQKDFNNGIVLLWAPGTRKVFIATGYGMEGVLPDIYAKKIITNFIAPNFKELRYYEGLDKATDEIIKYASGEYKAEPKDDDGGIGGFIFIIIVLIIIFIIIRKNRGGGGGGGRGLFDAGFPYTTYTGWGRQSGSWGGGGWSGGGGGGGGFGGFGGGSFGGGGAGGDY